MTPLLQVIYNVRVLGDGDDADVLLEAEVPELRRPVVKEVAVVHAARDDGYTERRTCGGYAQAEEEEPLHRWLPHGCLPIVILARIRAGFLHHRGNWRWTAVVSVGRRQRTSPF